MRLTHVQLNDFRAFPGNFDLPLPNGCNLLLYGENGSGKSSLAVALRDFIALDRRLPRPIAPYAHAFPNPAQRQPHVRLTFHNAGAPDVIVWQPNHLHPLDLADGKTPAATTQAQREQLVAIARQSGFYDYRALLKTSFRSGDGELSRQLFYLFVETLLGGFPLARGGSEFLRERWRLLEKSAPRTRHARRLRDANRVADALNNALLGLLDISRVEANRLLSTYFPNHRLAITALAHPGCRFRKEDKLLIGQAILPEIEYNGMRIERHEEFLNEARLSALGLTIFLAALKGADPNPNDPDPLRLLVLDDVLIGLDISNRLPLLELLRVEFPYHQTILLTHDELWFNIAREHTQHWGTWRSAQLYAEFTGPADPPLPRLKGDLDDLQVAQRYLDSHDLKSSAVYVRSAFEAKLRKTCEDQRLRLEFKQDIKKVSAQMLWDAVTTRHTEMLARGQEFIDPGLLPRLNAVRSQVLNRLAHDGGLGLTGPDVQAAINALRALRASQIPHRT